MFSIAGLELFAWRLPIDGTEVSLLASGDDKHFLDTADTDKEQFLMANATVKRQLSRVLTGSVSVQYYYMDQVFDASTTEFDLGVVVARGHYVAGKPVITLALNPHTWLDFEELVAYQWLAIPLDDYMETGPRVAIRHEFGRRSEFQVSYCLLNRDYATRSQVSSTGVPLPDTDLVYEIHRAEAAWRQNWDSRSVWRTTAKIGLEANHDNGSGYFDYTRYYGELQVRYERKTWEARARFNVSRYEYDLQIADANDPTLRRKTLLDASVSASIKLGRRFRAFAEYEHEQSLANQESDQYKANTLSGGLDAEF